MFDIDRAKTGYGWLQDLHKMTMQEVNGRKTITPKPETEEYNVRNFVYTRRQPFHPRRLFELVYDKFILTLEYPDDDDDEEGSQVSDETEEDSEAENENNEEDDEGPSNQEILANKRAHPLFSRLFRSKGEFFLATRPGRAGEWSQAGAMLTLVGGRPWFCTLPKDEYETGDPEVDALVQHDISKGGQWGDRRQEIVFIGENTDETRLEELLDTALLTDEEMKSWVDIMLDETLSEKQKEECLREAFDDRFPEWSEDQHDHDHDHDREWETEDEG